MRAWVCARCKQIRRLKRYNRLRNRLNLSRNRRRNINHFKSLRWHRQKKFRQSGPRALWRVMDLAPWRKWIKRRILSAIKLTSASPGIQIRSSWATLRSQTTWWTSPTSVGCVRTSKSQTCSRSLSRKRSAQIPTCKMKWARLWQRRRCPTGLNIEMTPLLNPVKLRTRKPSRSLSAAHACSLNGSLKYLALSSRAWS